MIDAPIWQTIKMQWKYTPSKGVGVKVTHDGIDKALITKSGKSWGVVFPDTPLYNTDNLHSIDAALGYTIGVENALKVAQMVTLIEDLPAISTVDLREFPITCGG